MLCFLFNIVHCQFAFGVQLLGLALSKGSVSSPKVFLFWRGGGGLRVLVTLRAMLAVA
jgi:hypothetical protein